MSMLSISNTLKVTKTFTFPSLSLHKDIYNILLYYFDSKEVGDFVTFALTTRAKYRTFTLHF